MADKPPKKPRRPQRKTPRQDPVLPVCKAFLLCEKAIMDLFTRSVSIIGLFTEFNIASFPCELPPFWIFLQLSDGLTREYPIDFEIHDLKAGAVIGKLSGAKATFNYRPEKYDVIVCVPPIRLKGPNTIYAVVAYTEGRVLAEQLFTIKDHGRRDEQPGSDQ